MTAVPVIRTVRSLGAALRRMDTMGIETPKIT